jgi:hypothetical protein
MIEGSNPDPELYLVLMDPDPGGPKTYGSLSSYGSGSAKLAIMYLGRYLLLHCMYVVSRAEAHAFLLSSYLTPTHPPSAITAMMGTYLHSFILSFLYVAGTACPQSLPIRAIRRWTGAK